MINTELFLVVSLGLLCSSLCDTMFELQRISTQHTCISLILQTQYHCLIFPLGHACVFSQTPALHTYFSTFVMTNGQQPRALVFVCPAFSCPTPIIYYFHLVHLVLVLHIYKGPGGHEKKKVTCIDPMGDP